MEKFTSKKTQQNKNDQTKTLYENKYMSLIEKGGWSYIKEPDQSVCIPILMETNEIILRVEDIPSYRSRDNQQHHLTSISGTIEEKETPTETIIRELEEEAGIRLNSNYKPELMDSLYKNKSLSSKFNLYILPIYQSDFIEVEAKGDGSKYEENSNSVKINLKNIDRLFPSDLVTKYLLAMVKEFMNL